MKVLEGMKGRREKLDITTQAIVNTPTCTHGFARGTKAGQMKAGKMATFYLQVKLQPLRAQGVIYTGD